MNPPRRSPSEDKRPLWFTEDELLGKIAKEEIDEYLHRRGKPGGRGTLVQLESRTV
ncbi:hypothetical protein LCGC14_0336570 [marine sediment metagenome]|uniref:Uncharacterized protein n=1 Tax=marine sediment metagenome TaxID=412755 RepID=A0A0F9TXY7_9ZZZZ